MKKKIVCVLITEREFVNLKSVKIYSAANTGYTLELWMFLKNIN